MRNLKIVLNKDTAPKVIKLNQAAIITLGFNNTSDDFNNEIGYNDLYITIPNETVKRFEQDNISLIGRNIMRSPKITMSNHITYIIFCDNYTIMN